MDPNFVQLITFRSDHPDEIVEIMAEWDRNQAAGEIMGYAGLRVLADRNDPGLLYVVAEFAAVDPDVAPAEEAQRNNNRPETQAAAARILALSSSDPVYHDCDEIYRTDPLTPGLGHTPKPR